MPSPSLTPAVEAQILAFIRGGGYAHVAAEAAGVSKETLAVWLVRGGRSGAREPYKSFAWRVKEAAAQARLRAEIATFDKVPLQWLRNGPGRETAEAPGWTGNVKPAPAKAATMDHVLTSPEWAEVWTGLQAALRDFPEARAAVAARLGETGQTGKR